MSDIGDVTAPMKDSGSSSMSTRDPTSGDEGIGSYFVLTSAHPRTRLQPPRKFVDDLPPLVRLLQTQLSFIANSRRNSHD